MDELTGLITRLALGGLLHASAAAALAEYLHTGEVEGAEAAQGRIIAHWPTTGDDVLLAIFDISVPPRRRVKHGM